MEVSRTDLEAKTPPHNIEAEQAVLGAILIDWTSMAQVVSKLSTDRFYSLQNQLVYDALIKLYTKGVRGDTLSLVDELTIEGKLEQAGGAGYIASLTEVVPSAANIEHYSDIVLDCSTRRELIKIAGELKTMAFERGQEDSKALLDTAEQKIFSLSPENNPR